MRRSWAMRLGVALGLAACTVPVRSTDDDDGGAPPGAGGWAPISGAGGAPSTVSTGGDAVSAATTSGATGGQTSAGAGGEDMPAASAGAGGAGPTTTGSGGATNGICNSRLTTTSAVYDQCLSSGCCAAFDACVADMACQACLTDGAGPGCSTNGLYGAFGACSDEHCPTEICGTPIGFTHSVTHDPIFGCNACADQHCCVPLTTCTQSGTPADVDTCLACMNNANGAVCLAAPSVVRSAALAFDQCLVSQCASDC